MSKKTIALTWWWSWWHIFPLVAFYNYFKEDWDYNFIWVWEEWWLEEEIAYKNKIEFKAIAAGKLRRYFDIRNLFEPLKNITGIFEAIFYILKYKIDIVFSKWGYVSIPLCIGARILWKKVYIHESDVKTWLSNKIVSRFATKVFYTFPNEKVDWVKHIVVWQILNPELLEYIEDNKIIENERLTIMVIAWSQWSKIIFEALLKSLPDLQEVDFHIILWEKNMNFREDFKKFPNTLVHDFVTQKRLWKILKNIDIAITRWSATSLWELNTFWVHSIIIPITNAWDHQEQNAMYFKKEFWSDILNENNFLSQELTKIVIKYKWLRKYWLNLNSFFKPLRIIKENIEK